MNVKNEKPEGNVYVQSTFSTLKQWEAMHSWLTGIP